MRVTSWDVQGRRNQSLPWQRQRVLGDTKNEADTSKIITPVGLTSPAAANEVTKN